MMELQDAIGRFQSRMDTLEERLETLSKWYRDLKLQYDKTIPHEITAQLWRLRLWGEPEVFSIIAENREGAERIAQRLAESHHASIRQLVWREIVYVNMGG